MVEAGKLNWQIKPFDTQTQTHRHTDTQTHRRTHIIEIMCFKCVQILEYPFDVEAIVGTTLANLQSQREWAKAEMGTKRIRGRVDMFIGENTFGCGSKLNRRGYAGLVHVSTYQGSMLVPDY